MKNKQGYMLKNWVEGLSDEAYWESPNHHKFHKTSLTFSFCFSQHFNSPCKSCNGRFDDFGLEPFNRTAKAD